MVHGVVDARARHNWVPLWDRISTEHFDHVIGVLAKYYNFVTLEEAIAMLSGRKKIKPYSMVVTFDDGYSNNLKYAVPILQKYDVPASIFLATGFIEKRKPFWIDRLDYALQNTNVNGRDFMVGGKNVTINSSDRKSFSDTYTQLRLTAKAQLRDDGKMLAELDDLAAQLENESGKSLLDIFEGDDWSSILTWEDVKVSSCNTIDYGAHTVDHVRLEYVSEQEARKQIQKSKEMIEQALGKKCSNFCYPNGSYNQVVSGYIKEAGFQSALTSDVGLNSVGDDLYTLKRIPFPGRSSVIAILSDVTGLARTLSKIYMDLRVT